MRLKNFDSVFQHVQGEEGPQPRQGDEERDLGKEAAPEAAPVAQQMIQLPGMTEGKFKETHPSTDAQVTLSVGFSVTCFVVGSKVFLQSPSKVVLPGVCSPSAKPLFMYAGGSWVSESAKVPRLRAKPV